MLVRSFFVALLMGMLLGLTANVAIADDKDDTAKQNAPKAEKKADTPPPPAWDNRGRGNRLRGEQPPRMRDGERRRPGMGGPGMGGPRGGGEEGGRRRGAMGGPGMGGPGMGGPGMGGPGMGGPGMGGPGMGGHGMGGPGGMMGPGMGRGRGFESMQKSDPEMYKFAIKDREFELQTMELCERFRRAPEEGRAEIKKHLEEVVGQHFEVRQQRRKLELTRMEEQLKRLNESIERRQESSEDIIKKRVSRLTGEKDPLEF